MDLTLLPTLQQQRALYDRPRDMARFREYLRQMTGGSDDIVLPLGGMNPMGKEKAVAAYDALLRLDAEAVAARALVDAQGRLARVPGALRVALVVQDDAQGTWSQPETRESAHWTSDAMPRRGFVAVHFLSSEAPYTEAEVRAATLEAVFRAAHVLRAGTPRSLADVMRLEGRAGRFAGRRPARGEAEVARLRALLAPHLASRLWAKIFAAMYGDASAERFGHEPLGLPARAGFDVALADAVAQKEAPEDALWRAATSR